MRTALPRVVAHLDGQAAGVAGRRDAHGAAGIGGIVEEVEQALFEGGDPRGAEVELRKAFDLKFSPDLTIPLLAKAMLAMGQANKVVEEFSKTELSGEAAANLKTLISQAYQALGNREAAQQALASALSAKPDYVPALIANARAKAAQDDIAGAQSIIDGILSKTPGDPDALMIKGALLASKGDQTGAMEQYMKAVQSKPDFIPAHSAIISTLMQKGSLDDAAKQLEIMKKVAPKKKTAAKKKAAAAKAAK